MPKPETPGNSSLEASRELSAMTEVCECLASALADHNIGRDERAWVGVSEAFAKSKALLNEIRESDA